MPALKTSDFTPARKGFAKPALGFLPVAVAAGAVAFGVVRQGWNSTEDEAAVAHVGSAEQQWPSPSITSTARRVARPVWRLKPERSASSAISSPPRSRRARRRQDIRSRQIRRKVAPPDHRPRPHRRRPVPLCADKPRPVKPRRPGPWSKHLTPPAHNCAPFFPG